MANTVYLDMEDGLARLRGNTSLYKRTLQMFLKSTEFQALEDAIAAGDDQKAGEIAHGIKGMTGNLSMPELFHKSTILMSSYRAGGASESDIDAYRDAYEKTRTAVEEKIAELD